MKSIVVHIDDKLYDDLIREAALTIFSKGCVSSTRTELSMSLILQKIQDGENEVTLIKQGDIHV